MRAVLDTGCYNLHAISQAVLQLISFGNLNNINLNSLHINYNLYNILFN